MTIPLSDAITPGGAFPVVDGGMQKLVNVLDPTDPQDVATKAYVDLNSGGSADGSDTYVQFNDGGTAFGGDAGFTYDKTANLLSLSDAIAFGADPATAGTIRLSNVSTILARNFADDADTQLVSYDASDDLYIGDVVKVANTTLGAATSVVLSATGPVLTVNTSNVLIALPIIGDVATPSQYGVHGVGTQAMGDTDQTVAAAIYVYNTIVTTDALTADRALNFPGTTDAAGYTKIINNTCTGGFNIVVGITSPGTTVSIPDGSTVTVLFDSRGATQVGIAQSGAASAAGTDTQVQFNDGGSLLGGDAGFTFDKTTGLLSVLDAIAFGADPATAGTIRMSNAFTLQARDQGDTADIQLMLFDASDDLLLGNITNVNDTTLSALTSVALTTAAGALTLTATLLTSSNPIVIGSSTADAGTIRLPNVSLIAARDVTDVFNLNIVEVDNTNAISLGNGTSGMYINGSDVQLGVSSSRVWLRNTAIEFGAGAAVASNTGLLRLPNLSGIRARNFGADGDIGLIGLDASDFCFVGCAENGTLGAAQVNVYSAAVGSVWLGSISAPMMKLDNATNSVTLSNITTVQNGNVNGGVTDVIRSLHTADNTVTDIYTWTIVEDAVTTVDALLTAITDDGAVGASYKRTLTFRESGGVVLVGALRDNQTDEDAAPWDVTIDDDGAGAGRIRVTGDAILGVTWFVSARLQHVILTP